jgi:putative ABC transport system permease protein
VRLWTGLVGSVVEAWSEVKVHRTRVLLSLIGVGVAVAALTTVVAGGAIATQVQTEQSERWGGRPATVSVNAYNPVTGMQATAEQMAPAIAGAAERYGIGYTTRNGNGPLQAQLPDGVYGINAQLVDRAYGVIHRTRLQEGEWFTERDVDRLAPPIIISSDLWTRLGSPDLRSNPTIGLVAAERTIVSVVTGVFSSSPDAQGMDLSAYLLNDDYLEFASASDRANLYYQYEFWIPPEVATELTERLRLDVAGTLGEGWQVDAWRQDYLAQGEDPLLLLKLAVGGVAVLVLLLGALSLVNIALVTVRHRIREIGIRRSFGATAGRVFFSVMMESVVATAFAGVVGVLVAVLLVKNPWVTAWLDGYVQDVPAFPVEAAVIGLVAATGVGALAGLLPALVAVRVKVIDAIRY